MRKALRTLLIVALPIGVLAVVAGAAYAWRDNGYRVMRAQNLLGDLQRLEIGKSDYKVAEAIASKFGNAPPPYWTSNYPKENCAARDHLEGCTYLILMNDSPVEMALLRHPSLTRLGFQDWFGNAQIGLEKGTVVRYSFWIWYKAANLQWRGFGASESHGLPRFEPVQARMSDSYSIQRTNLRGENGEKDFGLESSLTPAATADERRRASHFDFACLAQRQGCGEICEVMPDAWKDFYEKRGHFDVEKLGSAYLFCSKPPQ